MIWATLIVSLTRSGFLSNRMAFRERGGGLKSRPEISNLFQARASCERRGHGDFFFSSGESGDGVLERSRLSVSLSRADGWIRIFIMLLSFSFFSFLSYGLEAFEGYLHE